MNKLLTLHKTTSSSEICASFLIQNITCYSNYYLIAIIFVCLKKCHQILMFNLKVLERVKFFHFNQRQISIIGLERSQTGLYIHLTLDYNLAQGIAVLGAFVFLTFSPHNGYDWFS